MNKIITGIGVVGTALIIAGCGNGTHTSLIVPASSVSASSTPSVQQYIMPKLEGQTAMNAMDKLDNISHSFKITLHDVTPKNRPVYETDKWIVCSQSITAGKQVANGASIQLMVGKDTVECKTKNLDAINPNSTTQPSDSISSGLTVESAVEMCDSEFSIWTTNIGNYSMDSDYTQKIFTKTTVVDGPAWKYVGHFHGSDGDSSGLATCVVHGTNDDPHISSYVIKYDNGKTDTIPEAALS